MPVPTGFVAARRRHTDHRVMLHLMREDQASTLCGLYFLQELLPEDADVRDAPTCRRCTSIHRLYEEKEAMRRNLALATDGLVPGQKNYGKPRDQWEEYDQRPQYECDGGDFVGTEWDAESHVLTAERDGRDNCQGTWIPN